MSWGGHRLSIFAFLLAVGFCARAWADEGPVPGSRYVPADAAAMGDAYLPLATDPGSALFYNPAGLASVHQDAQAQLDLKAYGDTGYFSSFSVQNPEFYKVTSLSSNLPALERNPGTYQGVGTSILPTLFVKGFAFGLLAQSDVVAEYNANGTVNYQSNYQLIPTAGTAIRLADGIIRLGYSLQWVNQASGQVNNESVSGANLGYNQNLTRGSAFSHTIGFAMTLPYRYLPQLDLVARNAFGTRFSGGAIMPFASGSVGTPATEQMTFDASLNMVHKLAPGVRFTWVLEDQDFTNRSGIPLLGRAALGVQLDFRQTLFFRGGWGSGYPDAGFGIRGKKGELSLSWANVELGDGYHDQRDTNLILQYQIRAF